jgi:hypothetical protein
VDSSDPYPSSMVQLAFIFVSLSPPSIFSPNSQLCATFSKSIPSAAKSSQRTPACCAVRRAPTYCTPRGAEPQRTAASVLTACLCIGQLACVSVSLLTYRSACLRIGQLHRQPCFATTNLMSIYNQLFFNFSTLVISCSEQDQMSNLVYVHHPY